MNTPKVYVMGDIHGKFQPIRDFWLRTKLQQKMTDNKEDQVLILLGDAGLNYYFDGRDDSFKEKLGKYPFTYFVIRGNHEERPSFCMDKDPDKWEVELFWNGAVYVEKQYPYIKYAWDIPSVYLIKSKEKTYKTLILPGAYSVDKNYRLSMGYSWFEGEQLQPFEMEWGRQLIKKNGNYDLVLSHTCPCIYEPTDLFLPMVDQSMVDKTMERFLGEVEFAINYKSWLWGHYHAFRDYPRLEDNRKRIMLFQEAVNLDQIMNEDIPEVL